jgi:hypothetical protein
MFCDAVANDIRTTAEEIVALCKSDLEVIYTWNFSSASMPRIPSESACYADLKFLHL